MTPRSVTSRESNHQPSDSAPAGGELVLQSANAEISARLAAREKELTTARERNRIQGEHFEAKLATREKELTAARARNRLQREEFKTIRAGLQAENRRLSGLLDAQMHRIESTRTQLLQEMHSLWNSPSWRLFRPVRNLVRGLLGHGRETEPSLSTESEAIQTIISLRQSVSWELTAPLRLIRRAIAGITGGASAPAPARPAEAGEVSNPPTQASLSAGQIAAIPPSASVISYLSASVEPELLPKQVWVGVSSLGNSFMGELAQSLCHAFRQLGVEARLFTERDDLQFRKNDTVIVVAPHEFFYFGEGAKAFEALGRLSRLIMVNTERPQAQWFAIGAQYFKSAWAILDINHDSARHLANSGYPAFALPLGYCGDLANRYDGRVLPEHELLKYLPRAALEPLPQSYSSRPIDVLFIGTSSPRRKEFFRRHADFFSRLNTLIYLPDSNAPLHEGESRTVDLATFVALVKRSKVLLNIHRDDRPYLDWHRIVTLGIMQRTLVITDHCEPGPCIEPDLDYLDGPLEAIPQLCELALSNAGVAELIADRAYKKLRAEYPMDQIVGRCFTALAKAKG